MSFVQLSEIDLPSIWSIRQKAMYPNDPIDIVKLELDDTNIHFGWMEHESLIAVITIENIDQVYQFRKFATLPHLQRKGFGSKLLTASFHWMQSQGASMVWCNARTSAIEYYQKFGMKETGSVWTKHHQSFIRMEKQF